MVLQALTPLSAWARGSAALSTQSRDMEAEMQKLIQSRVKEGQPPLPELKLRSGVSYCSLLSVKLLSRSTTANLPLPGRPQIKV